MNQEQPIAEQAKGETPEPEPIMTLAFERSPDPAAKGFLPHKRPKAACKRRRWALPH